MKTYDFTGNQSHHIIAAMKSGGLARIHHRRRSFWKRLKTFFTR